MYRADDMPKPVARPPDRGSGPTGELDRRFAESPRGQIPNARALRANYAGKVTLIDDQIGQILSEIETRGELDRTIILFTSDHGEMNGDYDLIHKSNFLNAAVRVPLIVSTPEIKTSPHAGNTSESLVEWFDAGPTLIDLAGAKINYTQFACSLVPVLQDPKIEHRRFAMSELALEVMYLDHDWKLFLNQDGEAYRLFDVKKDPNEMEDLVVRKEYADLTEELKRAVRDRWRQTQETRD